ncbi:MAG: metallophosphoesterase [Bryobacteraceae bacterium]|jgi:diadenosine tetraphosphatase ApaH/serine/threonine PP2A family protein phosphatase|nr:MAG: metallophosphoesterase [Bryobacteraceae bacterium]
MRRLILSDIHSNRDALEAVLRDAAGQYDEIVCCGDLVGYNACPKEVVAWAMKSLAQVVRGNHDRVCAFIEEPNDFNHYALEAARWTHAQLSPQQLAWLRSLPAGPLVLEGYELVHGSPYDEDEYVVDRNEALAMEEALHSSLCFFGHTHLQGGWMWTRGGLLDLRRPRFSETEVVYELEEDAQWLVNPGSVGQPRDRDPRAAYALWDVEGRTLAFRRVEYNVEAAQKRILDAGLPEHLAIRLAFGR